LSIKLASCSSEVPICGATFVVLLFMWIQQLY
jgi:hypothetical protein